MANVAYVDFTKIIIASQHGTCRLGVCGVEITMDEIVERLRKWGDYGPAKTFGGRYAHEAADEIERLRGALGLQESAEENHANCTECDGEEVPELCPKCFPLYDDARLARRRCLALTRGDALTASDHD